MNKYVLNKDFEYDPILGVKILKPFITDPTQPIFIFGETHTQTTDDFYRDEEE